MVGTWYLARMVIYVVDDRKSSAVTDGEQRTGRQAPSMGRCAGVLGEEPVLLSLLLLRDYEQSTCFSDRLLQLDLKLIELSLLPSYAVICVAKTYAGPTPSTWKQLSLWVKFTVSCAKQKQHQGIVEVSLSLS